MKQRWDSLVTFMGYLMFSVVIWAILFGGRIQLGNPMSIFK